MKDTNRWLTATVKRYSSVPSPTLRSSASKLLISVASAAALALLTLTAAAIDERPAFDDAMRQDRYLALVHELRCVVCQNQTIADSNADLAADLRRQVRDLMAAGKSDSEIKHYLTDRYGDFILYDPPLSAQSILLWAAPGGFLLLGVWIVFRIVRQRSRQLDVDQPS